MKKIAICSLLACVISTLGYAAPREMCDHLSRFDTKNNNHNAGADEYLFPSELDYRKASNTPKYYYCDEDKPHVYCGQNTYVKGKCFMGGCTGQDRYFRCETDGNDRWIEINQKDIGNYTKCTNLTRGKDDSDSLAGSSNAESNDYVFPDQIEYNIAGEREWGMVYECDDTTSNTAYCKIGTYITLPAGHYFQRMRVPNKTTYKCVHNRDDFWVPVGDEEGGGNGASECKNVGDVIGGEVNCSLGYGAPDTKTGDKCVQVCIQNRASGKLFANYFIKTCPASRPRGVVSKNLEKEYVIPKPFNYYSKCEESNVVDTCAKYSNNAEAYACCKYKNANWNEKTNKCDCKKSKAEWKWDAKKRKGICKVPGNTKPDDDDDDDDNDDENPVDPNKSKQCWYQFDGELRCANGAYISQSTGYYVEVKGDTCESFKAKFGNDKAFMMAMLTKFCSQQGSTPVVPDDRAFNAAKDSLNAFFNNAKNSASVWKDSEGKFNTARLASDLTAGVVLGTVGGVVSGVVIKKKQVEKGFDALHCTVGGQKVADWGDEFNIGLRR